MMNRSYDSGRKNHCDESQTDEEIKHLSPSLEPGRNRAEPAETAAPMSQCERATASWNVVHLEQGVQSLPSPMPIAR